MSSFRFFVLACLIGGAAILAACAESGNSAGDGDVSNYGDYDADDAAYVPCKNHEDCGSGYYCDDGTCRDADCDDEHPCRTGYKCVDFICISDNKPDGDTETDCPDGTVWSDEYRKCISEDGDAEEEYAEEEPLPIICEANEVTCHANVLDTCSGDGTAWEGEECPEGTVCLVDSCITKVCTPLEIGDCANEFFVFKCNPQGTGWEEEMCPEHHACLDNHGCRPITCSPGASLSCIDGETVKICNEEGNDYFTENCPDGTTCFEDGCQPFICEAGQWKCEGSELYYCNPLGTAWEMIMDCETADSICADGTCIDQICTPGARTCMEGETHGVKECNESGSAWVDVEVCGEKEECREGQCLGLCEVAEVEKGYVGCHYWPVDLENSGRDDGGQFGVIVSNPQSFNVNVTVRNNTQVLSTQQLAPGELKIIQLGSTQRITGPTKSYKAFHIESDAPVTAAQMNPYGNVLIYSNDASLLLPQSAMSTEYYGLTWPTWRRENCYCDGLILFGACIGSWDCDEINTSPGTLTIAATEEGTTNITITYSCATLGGDGVTAASAGTTQNYTLQRYEVLNLESGGTDCSDVDEEEQIYCSGPDLSGTKIVADKKVAVYGGHRGTFIPYNQWAADHLEHQLFPIDTWGKKFAVVRTQPRGSELDYYKIVAAVAGTRIEFSPDPTGQSPKILNAGQAFTFATTQTFTITSTEPIMVAHFLAGQDATGFTLGDTCDTDADCPTKYICCIECGYACSPEAGDPAMMLLAPDQQFRQEYIFQVPPNYKYDYMTLVAPPDTIITLDSTTYDSNTFTWINVDNKYYRAQISDGAHTIHATKPIGLYLYGYSAFVSYAYTGGLDLKTINPKP